MKKFLDIIYQFRGWITLNLIIFTCIVIGFATAKQVEKIPEVKATEEGITNIKKYTAEYNLTVNSNKTQNIYKGIEVVNNEHIKNSFKDSLENKVEITETENEITINSEKQKRSYIIPKKKHTYTMLSFKDFIEKYKLGKQNNKEYIVKNYEENNNLILEIKYRNEKKVKISRLVFNKTTKKPVGIINYDEKENIISKIDYTNFKVGD